MLNVTAIEAWDIFYICATKFNDNSQGTVIALGIIYSIVGIISAILNVYLLYLVATRRKLRKPSNLVMFPLLWNNIVLILGIIPMTLLELIVTKLQTSKHYISVRYYLSKTYITLCFYSVVTIALFRMRKMVHFIKMMIIFGNKYCVKLLEWFYLAHSHISRLSFLSNTVRKEFLLHPQYQW